MGNCLDGYKEHNDSQENDRQDNERQDNECQEKQTPYLDRPVSIDINVIISDAIDKYNKEHVPPIIEPPTFPIRRMNCSIHI